MNHRLALNVFEKPSIKIIWVDTFEKLKMKHLIEKSSQTDWEEKLIKAGNKSNQIKLN